MDPWCVFVVAVANALLWIYAVCFYANQPVRARLNVIVGHMWGGKGLRAYGEADNNSGHHIYVATCVDIL